MLERDENVAIDCHQNHGKHRNTNVAVEDKRKDLAKEVTEGPRSKVVANRLHWHHQGTEKKIGESEGKQKRRRGVFP